MRKILALMLAALVILSGMVFVAAADEAPSRVAITAGDTLSGWHGAGSEGIPEPELNTELSDYDVVSFTYTGHLYANGGWSHPEGSGKKPTNGIKIMYLPAETEAESHDITGMKVLAFDLYVSNAAKVENLAFELELGSGGRSDIQEMKVSTWLKGMKGASLTNGWNHFEMPLATFAISGDDKLPVDMTAWNFMRLYNVGELNLGDEELVLAFRDIYFSSTTSTNVDAGANQEEMTATENRVPVFGCNTSLGEMIPDPEEKTAGLASITYTFRAGEALTKTNRSRLGYTVDGTGMDSLEFDLYISDLGLVQMFTDGASVGDSGIELSSEGKQDCGEYAWRLTDIFAARSDWKVGWNHVTLSLESARETLKTPSAPDTDARNFDISKIDFFGIYWVLKAAPSKDYTLKVDNVALTTAQAGMADKIAGEIEPILAMAEPLDGIKLADINADNYESYKTKLAELETAYGALSPEAREKLDAQLDVGKIIRSLTRALENYAATLTPDEPADGPATDDPAKDDPTPDVPATDDPATDAPATDVPATDDPATDAPATDDAEKGNMAVYLIIGGAALLVVIAVIVVIVMKKKK